MTDLIYIFIFLKIISVRFHGKMNAFATSKIYFHLNYANLLSHHYKKLRLGTSLYYDNKNDPLSFDQ